MYIYMLLCHLVVEENGVKGMYMGNGGWAALRNVL